MLLLALCAQTLKDLSDVLVVLLKEMKNSSPGNQIILIFVQLLISVLVVKIIQGFLNCSESVLQQPCKKCACNIYCPFIF